MKKILFYLALILLVACNEDKKADQVQAGGAIIEEDSTTVIITSTHQEEVAMKRGGKGRPKPPVIVIDTTVITPPIDTVVITPTTVKTYTFILEQGISKKQSLSQCVSHAVTYAVEIYYKHKSGALPILSPDFNYSQCWFNTGTGCGVGTSMQKALDVYVYKGGCSLNNYPVTSDCTIQPTSAAFTEALNYKIPGYAKILITDRAAIKAVLMQGKAVIITVLADNDFIAAKSGYIWKSDGAGMLAHTILIIGWSEERNTYVIMNSLGTTWCDNGIGEIDRTFLESGVVANPNCYVIN